MFASQYFTRSLAALLAASMCGVACGRSNARYDSTAASAGEVSAPNASTMVRGVVSDVTSSSLVIKTDTGSVTLALASPPKVFDRESGSLSDVADNAFVGVTSVKQPDGKEQATEIHVFPEDLRGLGEGSHMMEPSASPSGSRMTNGSVQASRMSNGTVSSSHGGTLVVTYAGGTQTIDVPPSTPVTVIKETSKQAAVGDQVVVVSKRGANGGGALTASSVLLVSK
ncbi:MAG TPA: hypothetical protein VGQ44_19210 [Gemmatimonadaceae bacterium]|nr:hypothetical protein [Gemmatimonadaceae bacterium]